MSSGDRRLDRQADRLGLERDAHHDELLEVGGGDRLDRHAAVGLRVDQPFALQHPQRLAQRRAADAELVGQRDLGHDRARRDLALEDRLAHAPVDLLDVVAAGGALGWRAHAGEPSWPCRRHRVTVQPMRVALVTGGAGAIGGAIVAALARDHEVRVLDRAECDLGDEEDVRRAADAGMAERRWGRAGSRAECRRRLRHAVNRYPTKRSSGSRRARISRKRSKCASDMKRSGRRPKSESPR